MKAKTETMETATCNDCLKEFLKDELLKCPDCKMLLCKICSALHYEEHLMDHYVDNEEDEEEYDKRPSRKNWD